MKNWYPRRVSSGAAIGRVLASAGLAMLFMCGSAVAESKFEKA